MNFDKDTKIGEILEKAPEKASEKPKETASEKPKEKAPLLIYIDIDTRKKYITTADAITGNELIIVIFVINAHASSLF